MQAFNKIVLTFIVFLYINLGYAQNKRKLTGSWQSEKTCEVICGSDTLNQYYSDYFPFYLTLIKDKSFRFEDHKYSQNNYCEAKYKLKRHKIIIKKGFNVPTSYNSPCPKGTTSKSKSYRYNYNLINDSTICLSYKTKLNICDTLGDKMCLVKFNLNKVNELKYETLKEINERHDLELAKIYLGKISLLKNDSTKTVTLSSRGTLEIVCDTFFACNNTINDIKYKIDAFNMSSVTNELLIHPIKIEFKFVDCNGYWGTKEKTFSSYKLCDHFQEMETNKISYLYYYKPHEYQANQISRTICWLSFITASIVSPIVSIQTRPSGFDKKRYFNLLCISGSLTAISFTIMKLTNGKQYLIGRKFRNSGWAILQ